MLLQGSAAPMIRTGLRAAYACLVIYSGLLVFGLMCLVWSGAAALLCYPLSKERGRVVGRWVTSYGFRGYLWLLALTGAFRFDLRALDALRDAGPLIIAPNHPSLLDAVMVLSRLPDVTCVMKANLIDNPIYNRLKGGAALASKRSGVPIQTVLIETPSAFLSKGWPLHRIPSMPVRYRIRLGRRFSPKDNLRETIAEMEAYLASELGSRSGIDTAGDTLPRLQNRLEER